jgi:hypothetical protein
MPLTATFTAPSASFDFRGGRQSGLTAPTPSTGLQLFVTADNPSTLWVIAIGPRAGESLHVGTVTGTGVDTNTNLPAAGQPVLMAGNCDRAGSFTIDSLQIDGQGVITELQATFSVRCAINYPTPVTLTGAIQFNAPPSIAVPPGAAPRPPAQPTAADLAFVKAAYQQILGRQPDADGLAYFAQLVANGTPHSQVALSLEGIEYRTDLIRRLYSQYLGRSGDAAGVSSWAGALAGGITDEKVRAAFLGSDEYLAEHAGTGTGFLAALYHDVLGRMPDDGQAWWLAQLATGRPRAAASSAFLSSPEARRDAVIGFFQTYLGRNPDPQGLAYWADQLLHGTTDEEVIASFVGSGEFASRAFWP